LCASLNLFRPEHWWSISELAHTSVDLAVQCSASHVFTDVPAVLVYGWGEADRNVGGTKASMGDGARRRAALARSRALGRICSERLSAKCL